MSGGNFTTMGAPGVPSFLSRIVTEAVRNADRILMIGTEGIGKTRWAGFAPGAIFITAEEGASQLGVARFPTPKDIGEVYAALGELAAAAHPYQTLVIDTVDALEPLIWDKVCKDGGKATIEDFGYGKGFTIAVSEWRKLIAMLDALREKRNMEIILLAHAKTKTFNNPAGPDYTRYEMTLNPQAAQLFKGWPDTTLFAMYEEGAIDTQTGKLVSGMTSKTKVKGKSTGRRVLKTQRTAAWDAKNRYDLPEELDMPLEDPYLPYAQAREAFWARRGYADPVNLLAEARELADSVTDDEKRKTAKAYIETKQGDAAALTACIGRLKALIASQAA